MKSTPQIILASLLVAALGTGAYENRRASRRQEQARALELQQHALTEQNQRLEHARDQATQQLAAAAPGARQSPEELSKLLKLRAEWATLRRESRELSDLKAAPAKADTDPVASEIQSWVGRVNQLKATLRQRPEQTIPELQFLTDKDWLAVAKDLRALDSEAGADQALITLRTAAKNGFANRLQNALRTFEQNAPGQSLTELSQLTPYFPSPFEESVFQRYELSPSGQVTEKPSPLGDHDDNYFQITKHSINSGGVAEHLLKDAGRPTRPRTMARSRGNRDNWSPS